MKRIFSAMALALLVPATLPAPALAQLVIAHRGASGERPEHTIAAYQRAIDQGADYIELDLVPTKDGVLVARHENNLSETTNVSTLPAFAARKTTKIIDGEPQTGWFAEDFTLAELRQLRARERLPAVRPANRAFDDQQGVPTLRDVIALIQARAATPGVRPVGLYLELKHPTYFRRLGQDTAALLVKQLRRAGLDRSKPDVGHSPVFIQCFEPGTLIRLSKQTRLPLVQLIDGQGSPADRADLTFAAMTAPAYLTQAARYLTGIGPNMRLVIGDNGQPLPLLADAHAAGLKVHVWTLRRENRFLPKPLQVGDNPDAPGNIALAWKILAKAGVDGVFTDNPGDVRSAPPRR